MGKYIEEAKLNFQRLQDEVTDASKILHACIKRINEAAQKAVMHIHKLSEGIILIHNGIEYKFASLYDKNPGVSLDKPWVKVYKKTASGWSKRTTWLSDNWEIKK